MDPSAINFNVLRRHDPKINSIIDSTSYAVIYRYFHGAWSKTGFEGTLFIFQRDCHPSYGLFVLNRQGLDNLVEGLLAGWDVDLDQGLIIWRSAGATGDADDDVIYGIWVYEEKDRSRIATKMQDLIDLASAHLKSSDPQPPSPPVSLSHPVPRVPIISAGQTISLDQLFGVSSASELPPPLPQHPTSGFLIDLDDQKENLSPSTKHNKSNQTQVMSPDPSDLPKGMQLLDSLFQKAAVKSQGSRQSSHPPEPFNSPASIQHQTNNHQNLTPPAATSKPSSQYSNPTKLHSTKSKKDHHREGANDESFKPQSISVDQPPVHATQRVTKQHQSSSRTDHHNDRSRRSSGGSSSRSRNDKIPLGYNSNVPAHQQNTQTNNNLPSFVPAPVPIENPNVEARQNILSLLGHPAALRADVLQSVEATVPQDSSIVPPQTIDNNFTRPIPNNHHANPYPPKQRPPLPSGPPSDHRPSYSHPGSQPVSHQPSPRQNSQQASPQHSLPSSSQANSVNHHTPSRTGFINPTNHSPHGPRPQLESRHNSHQANNNIPGGLAGQRGISPNPGQPAAVFTNSVWPFDKLGNRALSPLNPARQSPSNLAGQYRAGGMGTTGNYASNLKVGVSQHQSPSSQHSPPVVNDSSRPSRSHSHAGSSHPFNGSALTQHPPALNSKLAVESLDELLIDLKLGSHPRPDDQQALDKPSFVNSIIHLIHSNPAFVDTLYARYQARYAEQFL